MAIAQQIYICQINFNFKFIRYMNYYVYQIIICQVKFDLIAIRYYVYQIIICQVKFNFEVVRIILIHIIDRSSLQF